MHPPRILVLATILGVLVAGCTPAAAPTPSPTPTVPQCTPEFGGDPFPCTQADHDAMVARQAQYAEAERVYEAYASLDQEELVARRQVPSDEMMALLGGRQAEIQADLRAGQLQIATFSGTYSTKNAVPVEPLKDADGSLALRVCRERESWVVTRTDGSTVPTTDQVLHVQFMEAGPLLSEVRVLEDAPCE